MTSTRKLNVLVYSGGLSYSDWKDNILTDSSGNGSTVESVRQCLYTLRRLLAPNYAVIPVTGEMIINEPWTAACALLVMPGGADQGYCRTLNGEGNRRITQFVRRGGAYIGFCAGGYYGCKRCEFEVGDKKMEVVGSRELAFFPGTCRGCAFPGFVYHSEEGARASELNVERTAFQGKEPIPDSFKSYYNGGGVFVDAPKYSDQGVEVLANYAEPLSVDPGEGAAAVVYCKVGDGAALLTGPHPEFVFSGKLVDNWELTKPRFAPVNLDKKADGPGYPDVIDALAGDDQPRTDFLKACLTKLGLRVNQESSTVPSLSRLHLSSLASHGASELVSSLQDIIVVEEGEEYLKDDNDTFHLEKPSSWEMKNLEDALPDSSEEKTDQKDDTEDRIVDYNTIVKRMVVHDELPAPKETPYFNHHAFYANLKHFRSLSKEHSEEFGSHILYGEVVTSTNTLLEK
jgi:biotin--protein ligase